VQRCWDKGLETEKLPIENPVQTSKNYLYKGYRRLIGSIAFFILAFFILPW